MQLSSGISEIILDGRWLTFEIWIQSFFFWSSSIITDSQSVILSSRRSDSTLSCTHRFIWLTHTSEIKGKWAVQRIRMLYTVVVYSFVIQGWNSSKHRFHFCRFLLFRSSLFLATNLLPALFTYYTGSTIRQCYFTSYVYKIHTYLLPFCTWTLSTYVMFVLFTMWFPLAACYGQHQNHPTNGGIYIYTYGLTFSQRASELFSNDYLHHS